MRIWKNGGAADPSVHCMGNGRLAVYARGPEIVQIFGPPYSSTSFIEMTPVAEEPLEVTSEREAGTAIWRHEIHIGSSDAGRMVDFVDGKTPVFVRDLELRRPLAFEVKIAPDIETLDNTRRFQTALTRGALLARSQRGAYVFMKYASPIRFNQQIVVSGNATLRKMEDAGVWRIECLPGATTILTVGGETYPACITNAEDTLRRPVEELLTRTRAHWRAFTAKRAPFETTLPADMPLRSELLRAIDDVAVLIKAQQGAEGGILAGSRYHWAAFRDMFGSMRCLLALGHHEEAKSILRFSWDIFRTRGAVHNGQDIGLNGFFHIHENDEVELTGYILTEAFDYRDATGDDLFLRDILPFLEWAFDAQVKHLLHYMIPFNGDETYIAGGMMPRGVINDGSAEATLLFVRSGARFLDWIEKNTLWRAARIRDARAIVAETQAHYRESFWRDGEILTNNPDRMTVEEMPRFRHGVCESWTVVPENGGLRCQGGAIGWVEKTQAGHYLCPTCFSAGIVFPRGRPTYRLASVSLVPLYLGSDMFTPAEIATVAAPIIDRYESTGSLPTTPDGTLTVGYDYGLLLYTLAEVSHPLAETVYRHMMRIIDSTGAWVEYYRGDAPVGCPCRPYESGINIEAALHFAKKRGSHEKQ